MGVDGQKGKQLVFEIIDREGKIWGEGVLDVKAETLMKKILNKVKRGSIIYTDRYKADDTLVTHGDYFKHLRIDKGRRFVNSRGYINGVEFFKVSRRNGCRNIMG
ncbi:MAG: transposase [Candidatus Hydrogenedens sp.]|nr:transposase [Candidatus Hydrogenedens sp.]